ncbi:MAG TPA: GAF domain-containing protein [Kofleriaceae bacterium]|nr:GAF domain-containing protein [Kofleriaceae bacterium]
MAKAPTQVSERIDTELRHTVCNSSAIVMANGDVDAEQLLEVLRTEFRRLNQVRSDRVAELDARIGTLEQDLRATEEMLIAAERQSARLASLYAAAYQLHSLDPSEITAALSEIAVDLLGAHRCLLLMTSMERPGYDVVELVPGSIGRAPFASAQYDGGEPIVDACLGDGRMRLGPDATAPTCAAVPLMLQGDVVGALVVLELLPQKPSLQREDRELLDLLAAHAASALVGARVFQDTQRKLRTLEGLVALLRRSPGGAR